MSKNCEHGNTIDPDNGINCLHCVVAASAELPPADSRIPDGVRQEFLEQALAFIMRQSMYEANGDQALGVATALKRAWLAGFKTGQAFPNTLH